MNHKTWFGGPTDYFNFTPGPEVQAARGTLADDSHPTEPPRLLINNDAPRKRANADNTPIPPKSSAASSDATSFKSRRPQLEVHTKLKTNIFPGTQAVRLGPEDEGNGLKDQGSINFEEPQAAQPPSHDSGISILSDGSIFMRHVSLEEFEALKQAAERRATDYKQSIAAMAREARERDRDHARELHKRDWETNLLKQKLESRVTGSSNRQPPKSMSITRRQRGIPKQPLLYVERSGGNRYNDEDPTYEIQYLYNGLLDQLQQTAAEVWILRVEMAQRRKDWKGMYSHANKAMTVAGPLNYLPMSARCVFYRGIALFYMRRLWDAAEDFEAAESCIGIYKEKEEYDFWTQELTKAKEGVSPAQTPQQSWFTHIRNSISFTRPTSTTSLRPTSQDSEMLRNTDRAMKDELGSALGSASFASASWPAPSPYQSVAPSPILPKGKRPVSALQRSRPASVEGTRPQLKRNDTLEVPTPAGPSHIRFDPLQEREKLRQRPRSARRPRAKTLMASFTSIDEIENPETLAKDVQRIDGILRKRRSNESLQSGPARSIVGSKDNLPQYLLGTQSLGSPRQGTSRTNDGPRPSQEGSQGPNLNGSETLREEDIGTGGSAKKEQERQRLSLEQYESYEINRYRA